MNSLEKGEREERRGRCVTVLPNFKNQSSDRPAAKISPQFSIQVSEGKLKYHSECLIIILALSLKAREN